MVKLYGEEVQEDIIYIAQEAWFIGERKYLEKLKEFQKQGILYVLQGNIPLITNGGIMHILYEGEYGENILPDEVTGINKKPNMRVDIGILIDDDDFGFSFRRFFYFPLTIISTFGDTSKETRNKLDRVFEKYIKDSPRKNTYKN